MCKFPSKIIPNGNFPSEVALACVMDFKMIIYNTGYLFLFESSLLTTFVQVVNNRSKKDLAQEFQVNL